MSAQPLVLQMSDPAQTQAAFEAAGWTVALMIQHGHARWVEPPKPKLPTDDNGKSFAPPPTDHSVRVLRSANNHVYTIPWPAVVDEHPGVAPNTSRIEHLGQIHELFQRYSAIKLFPHGYTFEQHLLHVINHFLNGDEA